jgi:hypothetical protein
MRTYFLLTTQAICLCLIATFFVTELTGITNGGVVGGWCINVQKCRFDETIRCPGNDMCPETRGECIGFGPYTCKVTTTQECKSTSDCNVTLSCACPNGHKNQNEE